MKRNPRRFRRATRATAALAGGLALLMAAQRPALADDRDLLRFDSAKPYVFILLDTSASMSLAMGEDEWTHGWADGPGSRLYQAKQALYNVFKNVDDVHFGFASYNQDGARVVSKHFIYFNAAPMPDASTWTLRVPAQEVDGNLTEVVALGGTGNSVDTRVLAIDGHALTFGTNSGNRVGGTCGSPLDLTTRAGLAKLQGLPINGVDSPSTRFWLRQENGGPVYLLEVRVPGTKDDGQTVNRIGQPNLRAQFEARRVLSCGTNADDTTFDAAFGTQRLNLNLGHDPNLFETLVVDGDAWQSGGDVELVSGIADFSDIVSVTDFDTSRPFSGKGWEGNYDSGLVTGEESFDENVTDVDPFCSDTEAFNGACSRQENLKPLAATVPSNDGRAMDKGDVLPFHWNETWRPDMLRRFDPAVNTTSPALVGDFGVARHFGEPGPGGALKVTSLAPPLVAADRSPLAKALNDVRCWYLGESGQAGSNKCKDTSFVEFGAGWEGTACGEDPAFGCRRPYLIVISDGEDTGGRGEDANADIGALNSHSGVRTWALNVGGTDGCKSGGGLHPIVKAGKGECIETRTQEELRETLESILGEIRTEARSFASAAVPSVQATVEQKIFLTSFVPLNDSPVWSGSVHSFIKPLPTDEGTGRPNTEIRCSSSVRQECHLWNAGDKLLAEQYPATGTDFLDLEKVDLRRVFYATQGSASGDWPNGMRLFDPISSSAGEAETKAVRHDLWGAFELTFQEDETSGASVNSTAEGDANTIVRHTLSKKSGTIKRVDPLTGDVTSETIEFLMGDVFHSTPLVIGTPANTLYFAGDLYGNEEECDANSGTANPGYRCFVQKQRFRRKMLLVGSNDGMLHAFDAGIFRSGGTDAWTGIELVDPQRSPNGSFDNGTGQELFAFVPRAVMPTLKALVGSQKQQFTVDGTVTVADVFVDPLRKPGEATFPEEDHREWRTVVVGGLREGGRGYYALDITQPDPVVTDTPLDFVPGTHGDTSSTTENYVPLCTGNLSPDSLTGVIAARPATSNCGPLPFPAVLWEFQDTYLDPASGRRLPADEEPVNNVPVGNLHGDLADGWSIPNIGRIRICKEEGTACDPTPAVGDEGAGDDLEDRFVAIFGGGMDVENKDHDWRGGAVPVPDTRRGNWLYMVDIETGEVLYKQALEGAAPSEPAAVDTDGDGYLDRIYIGTLAGFLYRVDLAPVDDALPAPAPTTVRVVDESVLIGSRVPKLLPTTRLPPDVWRPVKIFDANWDGSTASAEPRQIFHRPSVIFDAISGKYLLAFGTGDRENLWTVNGQTERFFVFRDDVASTATTPPPTVLTEADLALVDRDLLPTAEADFLLTDGGWSLVLGEDERVITDGFSLSGLTIFSSFTPRVVDEGGNVVNVGCGRAGQGGTPSVGEITCSKQGFSHIFVVNSTNANGLLFSGDTAVRYKEVSTFVTNPFAEPGQTKNAEDEDDDGDGGSNADELTADLIKVMDSLKALFPSQCKFANYRVDVKTIAADTSLQFIAPVPVCIIERNWKEF